MEFVTQTVALTAKRTGGFKRVFTVSLDLTGWTVEMQVGKSLTLTAGSGLTVTVTPASGDTPASTEIVAVLSKTQTTPLRGPQPFFHRWTDLDGDPGYPIDGTITFEEP